MGYKFTHGPKVTRKSVAEISRAIEEVGDSRRFMGAIRRAGTRLNAAMGPGEYGAFKPAGDDDPFALSDGEPTFSLGWHWGTSVTNSFGTLRQGWQIVFHVFDEGATRKVIARVNGGSERREVKRFAEMVFDLL